ncbi:MAG: CoA transferase [Actinobacteria bacterium]|nr:CoA transferase [Actinomycetota bacterium]
MAPPLAGVRVVELGVALAGPAAAGILAAWGAEVVKVEPHEGDPQRGNTTNAYFSQDNRAKRSIALDLSTPQGSSIMASLLDRADVFVTNVRAAGLTRLGLDPTTVLDRNPRLVYGRISGYGFEGPAADRPGYDVGAFWSRAGVAAALVGPGNEPPIPRPAMGDHTTGVSLAAAILAGLFDRERTGEGRLVQTSLLRAGAFAISSDLAAQVNGEPPETGLRRALYNPMLGCYQAADGRWFFLLGLQAMRHWPNVLAAIGREDLLDDERLTDLMALVVHRNEIIAAFDAEFAKHPLDEWARRFAEHDVWWDPVQSLEEIAADPIAVDAGVFRPTVTGRTAIAPPADVDPPSLEPMAEVPELGQHTEEILLELGFDWDRITALADEGVIP